MLIAKTVKKQDITVLSQTRVNQTLLFRAGFKWCPHQALKKPTFLCFFCMLLILHQKPKVVLSELLSYGPKKVASAALRFLRVGIGCLEPLLISHIAIFESHLLESRLDVTKELQKLW